MTGCQGGELNLCYSSLLSYSVVKLWGNGRVTVFPFRFTWGNAVPLAYTTAVGGCGERYL